MVRLDDHVCVVTGAGHGLGEATAIELGSRGATVVVNDLGVDLAGDDPSDEPVRETAAAVEDAGGTAVVSFGDVTDLDYAAELVEAAVDAGGRLDQVVNFAGIQRDSLVHEMSESAFDSVLDVHLKGHFATLRAATRHWRAAHEAADGFERHRSYVAISSGRARGGAGQLNYSAAKAGVLGLMRSAARELHEFDVRANALMPVAKTRMTMQAADGYDYPETVDFESLTPDRVTPMIAFLASEDAADVNGCTLAVGGEGMVYVTDPDFVRSAYREGGWTAETIAASFDQFTSGESTFKVAPGGVSDYLS
ncbi:MAG: SDR family NAD(P)-dependent oxidoreductase [Halorhabdus sp.]